MPTMSGGGDHGTVIVPSFSNRGPHRTGSVPSASGQAGAAITEWKRQPEEAYRNDPALDFPHDGPQMDRTPTRSTAATLSPGWPHRMWRRTVINGTGVDGTGRRRRNRRRWNRQASTASGTRPTRHERRRFRARSSSLATTIGYALRMMPMTRQNRTLPVVLALFFVHSVSFAQLLPDALLNERQRSASDVLLPGSVDSIVPLEAPVDPRQYFLVPGDQLFLGIWGDRTETYRTVVTPDGHLVVPDLLAVDVRGLTLQEGAESVKRALAPLYPRDPIELHLLELGKFRVTVTGAVARPGLYETNGAERLSDLIEAAEGIRREASLRRIRVRPRNAAIADLAPTPAGARGVEVDLAGWYLNGDPDSNPHLRPGDVVEVPTRESYVEVGGAIGGATGILAEDLSVPLVEPNRPEELERVRIEWIPGDRISDVLALSGGLGDAASGRGLLVTKDGIRESIDLFDPADLERPVSAFSRLEVENSKRWVYVVGAVRSPGRYPYYPGLAPRDYVLLAGGETENGRTKDWQLVDTAGNSEDAMKAAYLEPGATLRVPERRSYWMGRILSPLSSAAALGISILILTNRR